MRLGGNVDQDSRQQIDRKYATRQNQRSVAGRGPEAHIILSAAFRIIDST